MMSAVAKRRVVVLGGNGFIGRRVVQALAASDWAEPVAVGRRAVVNESGIAHLAFDATDRDALRAGLSNAWGVVNCVSGSAETISRGAEALFDVAGSFAPQPRIVHLSSLAVYGEATGSVDESTPPTLPLSPYGAAKVAAERAASAAQHVVILRPGIVYGPGSVQWTDRIAKWLLRHRIGDLGARGDGCCNLVYVDDVVQAILLALQLDLEVRVFNLSLPQPPTWNEYFLAFAKALGAVPLSRVTGRRLKLETKLLAPPLKIAQIVAQRVLPSGARLIPEPIPPSVLRLFAQDLRLRVDAAEQTLGMRWRDLSSGLAAAAETYRVASRR